MTGNEATFGDSTDKGIKLAVDEQNKKGGVKGKQLTVKTLDDQGKPEEAAVAAFLQTLEYDPASGDAFRALERLYSTDESWRALDELLSRRIPFAATGGEATGTPESRRGHARSACTR